MDKETQQEVAEHLEYAQSYLRSAKNIFTSEKKRFDNDFIYNLISISFERFMIGLIAHHDMIASSHLPLMLYREALGFEPELGESIKKTAILIGSFEGICSIEDFGYKTPTNEQTATMIAGLEEVESFILSRVA